MGRGGVAQGGEGVTLLPALAAPERRRWGAGEVEDDGALGREIERREPSEAAEARDLAEGADNRRPAELLHPVDISQQRCAPSDSGMGDLAAWSRIDSAHGVHPNFHAGQMVGKADYDPTTRVFVNLSSGAMEALWESFNDVADGFGISLSEMQLICQELTSELEIGRPLLDKQVLAFFAKMDSDENALVDAIEFLATLAMASGMSARDKLEFVFTCFDFDGAGQLSVDEITLAFRCTLMGLCKITGEVCPCEEELEVVAMRAFSAVRPDVTFIDGNTTQSKHTKPIIREFDATKLRILASLRSVTNACTSIFARVRI